VKDSVSFVGEASLQEYALGRQVARYNDTDETRRGASRLPDLHQRLGDLGGETLSQARRTNV